MADQIKTTQQVSFAGGLNALSAPHALAPDEVQSSTNIDYSKEWGAAEPRQGSELYGTVTHLSTFTSSVIYALGRNYAVSSGTWRDGMIPWLAQTYEGANYYGTLSSTSTTLPLIARGTNPTPGTPIPQITAYNGSLYFANGTNAYTVGTGSVYRWLMDQPGQPTVVFNPEFGNSIPFPGFQGTASPSTYTATEGTITGTSTSTVFGVGAETILATCTTGTGTRIVLIGTVTNTNWENPQPFITTPTGTAVTSATGTFTLGGLIDFHHGWPAGDTTGASGPYNGTATITQTLTTGNYGADYQLLALLNQQTVVTIQRDLSIGDATFTNYWHTETTASQISDVGTDPVEAMLQASGNATQSVQQAALNTSQAFLPRPGGRGPNSNISPIHKTAAKTTVSASVSPWAVSRSSYQFIGALSSPDFTNIKAVRVIIEFNSVGQGAVIGGLVTYGGLGYPLNDQVSGISYFQTLARVENNVIVAEGAASLPSTPQTCQYAHAAITPGNFTIDPQSGVTHIVFYRTGGLLSDAYRVGSCAIGGGTSTIYDYALADLQIINNQVLTRNLWSKWPAPSAGSGLSGVNALSAPWQNRVWVGVGNQLYWSKPGIPTQVQDDTQTTVSDNGDSIAAILPAQNLVIVNQNSVFEMAGSVFEGTAQNWTLTRTQASRGCAAPRTCIQTPQGIILFGYSGISVYRQGYGIDQELDWVYSRIGDLWKGTGSNDPAAVKGRIPALNQQAIYNACAAYKDEKVYLAVPTGTSTYANTVFTLDGAHQKVWMSKYPFNITAMFWDRVDNRLMVGTDQGAIMQLETGLNDELIDGTPTGIGWSYQTREWSTPVDQIMENLQVENVGVGQWNAVLDRTNTYLINTFSAPAKTWTPGSLRGSIGDNLSFILGGTMSGTQQAVYALEWDAIPERPKVLYYQTDPIAVPSENYVKTWLADLTTTGFNTVLGTVLVDGTVVQVSTFSNSSIAPGISNVTQRKVYETGLPNITTGKNIITIYNSPSPFRHYDTSFEFEAKPFGKVTWLITYKKAGGVTQADMARFFAMDIEGSSTSTITTSWIIDGTLFSTNTLIFGATDVGEDPGIVRNYMDQIPFPPGGRGYLFQQQITSVKPFMVWRASLDIDRIGIKGLSRVTLNGTPSPGSAQ